MMKNDPAATRPAARPAGAPGVARPSNAARPASAVRPAGAARTAGATRPAAPSTASGPLAGASAWLRVAENRYGAVKVVLVLLLLLYVRAVLGANSFREVPFAEIAGRLAADPSVAALSAGDANAFQERFGLDPEGGGDWLLYTTDELMDVSELLIVRGADDAALERFEAAARARLDAQKESFRNYGTNQYDLLQHAILWQRGGYLFYGVSESADRWEEEFLSCVR